MLHSDLEEEEREKEGKKMRKKERSKEIQNKVTDTGTTPYAKLLCIGAVSEHWS